MSFILIWHILDIQLTKVLSVKILSYKLVPMAVYTFFYKQLDFPSEPGVAAEILENEPKSCLTVA